MADKIPIGRAIREKIESSREPSECLEARRLKALDDDLSFLAIRIESILKQIRSLAVEKGHNYRTSEYMALEKQLIIPAAGAGREYFDLKVLGTKGFQQLLKICEEHDVKVLVKYGLYGGLSSISVVPVEPFGIIHYRESIQR